MDPSLWFLNGFESGAPEQPASGEVNGDEEEDDKERTRLHQRCEIKNRGYYVVPCASAGHWWLKRPPEGEKKRGGWRRERRVTVVAKRAREESETGERERATLKMN